jgi:hypothetical protein
VTDGLTDGLVDPAGRERLLREISPDEVGERHALLRSIFSTEMDQRLIQGQDEFFENLYRCAYLLYLVGDPSDVPMMWEAKHIDFDTAIGFDVQFLLGAGVRPTLDYLRSHGHADIAADLANSLELADDLQAWSQFRRGYFYPET